MAEVTAWTPDQPSDESIVARYCENHLGRKQVVTLYVDRAHVVGSQGFANDFEWTVPLAALSPTVQRGRFRNPLAARGVYLLIAWGIVFTILADLPSVSLQSSSWGLFFALPVLFLIFILLDPKKREYRVVCNAQGTPLFRLVKNPPDGSSLDRFVSTLQAAIHRAAESSRDATAADTGADQSDVN